MNIEEILEIPSASFLIIEERLSREIVVGVPHHGPTGIQSLPCPEHEQADENVGYLGRYVAERLNCCSVIASNYRMDANKTNKSDYFRHIEQWNPRFLIEIHGHKGDKAKADIEISSGSREKSPWSLQLEAKIKQECARIEKLRHLSICGRFEEIYFKATNSQTITDDRWISFHLELPVDLRKPDRPGGKRPSLLGYAFCDCLVASLKEMCLGCQS